MQTLFNPSDLSAILSRIEHLKPDAQRQWGKMNVSQMLAHCEISIQTAIGNHKMKRAFIGRLIGSLIKKQVLTEKPWSKNSPTDQSYIFKGEHDFQTEKSKLIASLKKFHDGGVASCTTHPHPFFGKFTPEQWGIFQWKHMDHHLKQFGV